MSRNHLLSRTDNRLEDFEANGRGELTQRQRDRLLTFTMPATPRELECETRIAQARVQATVPSIGALILLITSIVLYLSGQPLQQLALVPGSMFMVIGGLALVHLSSVHYHQNELKRLRVRRDKADTRFRASLDSSNLTASIGREEGQLVLREGHSGDENQIQVGTVTFQVTDDLLRQLRGSDRRKVAYYFHSDQHGNVLLSIQDADYVNRVKLHEVVGISDDGEIIYQQDLEDDIPDGEVRPLKKSSDSGQ